MEVLTLHLEPVDPSDHAPVVTNSRTSLLAPVLPMIGAMVQKAGALLFSMLFTAACGVGSDGGDPPKPDSGPVEPINPNPLSIKCTDSFKVTGSFTPSTARPTGVEGCWGAGTWTFQLSLDPSNEGILDVNGDKQPDRCGQVAGTQAAMFKTSYSFSLAIQANVDGEYENAYTMGTGMGLAADCNLAGDCLYRLKVQQDGARECEAGMEIYSADRKMHWNLKPNQETGSTTIEGNGDFTLFNEAQVL